MKVDVLSAEILKEKIRENLGEPYQHLISNLSIEENVEYILIESNLFNYPELPALIKALADLQITNVFIAMEGDRMRWSIRRKEIVYYDIYEKQES